MTAEQAHKAGDFEEQTRHHQPFHVMLGKSTHNPILIATTEGIMEITRQFVKAIGPSEVQNYTLPSRKRLLVSLRAHDSEGAVKEMTKALCKVHKGYMIMASDLTKREKVFK